jgi:lipooligosaccharide transport system ATP-binding protein
MDDGEIVDAGSPNELIAKHVTREVIELRFDDVGERDDILAPLEEAGHRTERLADRALVYTDDGDKQVAALIDRGVRPTSVYVRRSTLEDVFLMLTGRRLIED